MIWPAYHQRFLHPRLTKLVGFDLFATRNFYWPSRHTSISIAQQISELISEPKQVLAIPGIGKGMLNNLQEMLREGRLSLHAELLNKYRPSMLQLLKVQGLGPKTIALIWSAYHVSDLDGVAKLAKEGKIRELPRMGEKQEQKILKAIEDYRRIAGRFPESESLPPRPALDKLLADAKLPLRWDHAAGRYEINTSTGDGVSFGRKGDAELFRQIHDARPPRRFERASSRFEARPPRLALRDELERARACLLRA